MPAATELTNSYKPEKMEQISENDIAVIGMAGRFPGANNLGEYWQNLVNGTSSIEKADQEKILASGISSDILNHKRFVLASSKLNDAKYFDADFFGLSNTEALHMDPQIRLLLQTSWHAMEDAGYDSSRQELSIGNFCGMSSNFYLLNMLSSNSPAEAVDPLLYRILNDKDFLATWISYKLNLTGPAMTVQTACSTSLLAVHLACQSLLNRECDMALAGGVAYSSDDKVGYIHTPGSIYSKDGLCRPFDEDASGTVDGQGVGTIVLKRASDAIKDQDHIYALIKGTATNNDGANKQGYTTPSVNCQRDVILEALAVADVDPGTIGMLEAHGTGTLIGDPIEVTALTEAFREYTNQEVYCAIGSVKSNIGHLDAAAGIASVIKAILCVYNGALVPSINFSVPNPALQLERSPFYVSQAHTSWPDHFNIRRAGVSSLGVGGTNVHLIVEQAPQSLRPELQPQPFTVGLSALNEESLQLQKEQLAACIRSRPELLPEDIEFTSVYGRKAMPCRFSTVSRDKAELLSQLTAEHEGNCFDGNGKVSGSVFLFPGQGSQYTRMAAVYYDTIEAFRVDVDYCLDYLKSLSATDFKEILFADDSDLLDKTENTQIALFIVEYCLARELYRSGIKPDAIVGHSLGEYVAACIVGCIALEDALKLVYHRGRLMGMMPGGAMLLVRATEAELNTLLLDSISVCALNAGNNIVVGGTISDIQEQGVLFSINNMEYVKLKVSHAYHTPMMTDVLDTYAQILSEVKFNPFEDKVFSTYTGDLVSPELFCSKEYWLDQIIHPVKFLDAVLQVPHHVSNPTFIEVGPGNGLSSFVKAIFGQQASTVQLLPKSSVTNSYFTGFAQIKAVLFAKGVLFNLPEAHEGRRVSLPGYVFSKKYFWKPKIHVQYQDFKEIDTSYHQSTEKYACERFRTSVEVLISGKDDIPEETLNRLNDLHTQYIRDVKALFPSEDQKIYNRIEVLYEDTSLHTKDEPSPDAGRPGKKRNISNEFLAPETEVERRIALYWAGVLGYDPVGVLDNYFEVGGNSLLATKLMSRLSDEFELQLTFRELSECLTIRELGALVESKRRIMELVEHIEIDNNDSYLEL